MAHSKYVIKINTSGKAKWPSGQMDHKLLLHRVAIRFPGANVKDSELRRFLQLFSINCFLNSRINEATAPEMSRSQPTSVPYCSRSQSVPTPVPYCSRSQGVPTPVPVSFD
ncbi:hypothetical protein ACLKA6_019302 [Drosophila palustris]